ARRSVATTFVAASPIRSHARATVVGSRTVGVRGGSLLLAHSTLRVQSTRMNMIRRVLVYVVVSVACLLPSVTKADPFLGRLNCLSLQVNVLESGASFGVT